MAQNAVSGCGKVILHWRGEMDDKYRQLIEDMAAKLGTTAEHLWCVLVTQAPISGAVDMVICIVMAAVTAWWVRLVMRNTTPKTTGPDIYQRAKWVNEDAFAAWFSAVLVGILALTFILVSAQGIVASFVNPEYWALMRLLKS